MFDKEYRFRGKHADMVKRLTNSLGSNVSGKLFATNYDVYAAAPLIGYLFNRKASLDKSMDSEPKIFADKMMNESEDLKYNYRLLMLLIHKDLDSEERARIAFKLDNNDEERKQYDELYDDYVRGGVEVIYEHIFEDANDVDGYLMNAYDFMEDFYNRYYADVDNLV